jgi:ketosteroid isomerase-like protein
MSEDNVETLSRYLDTLNKRGESPAELIHPEWEGHMFRGSPIPGPYRGRSGHERWRRDTFDVIEDWRIELHEVIETDDPDLIVAFERFVGRLRHTGLEANFPLAVVVRFRDGLISRFDGYRERVEALEAAGLEE